MPTRKPNSNIKAAFNGCAMAHKNNLAWLPFLARAINQTPIPKKGNRTSRISGSLRAKAPEDSSLKGNRVKE